MLAKRSFSFLQGGKSMLTYSTMPRLPYTGRMEMKRLAQLGYLFETKETREKGRQTSVYLSLLRGVRSSQLSWMVLTLGFPRLLRLARKYTVNPRRPEVTLDGLASLSFSLLGSEDGSGYLSFLIAESLSCHPRP